MIIGDEKFGIRELLDSDKLFLVKWLNDPLILQYYEGRDNPHDTEMVNQNFYQQEDNVTCCIIEFEQKAIGYIQFYPLDSQEKKEYGYDDLDDIYGTDQFIGEIDYWDKGIGMKEITSIRIDPAIKRLLSYATSEEKIDEEYNKYICSPNRKLYSGGVNGKIISCIGVEILNSRDGVIKHIAVLPKERGSGMGSSMIRFICKEYNLNSISAETDKDAVLFYDNFGFRITSLGEKYPGVERFLCELDLK